MGIETIAVIVVVLLVGGAWLAGKIDQVSDGDEWGVDFGHVLLWLAILVIGAIVAVAGSKIILSPKGPVPTPTPWGVKVEGECRSWSDLREEHYVGPAGDLCYYK